MLHRRLVLLTALISAGTVSSAQPPATSPLVERVADTGFIQLQADSFRQLDARQQALAYWLTQASIAIDPIIYDQLSQYGLRQKRLLEEIMARPAGVPPQTAAKIREFALLFWANRGNHNENTGQKFLPTFSADELRQAALNAHMSGGFTMKSGDVPALPKVEDVERELRELSPSLFDPNVEPITTAKTPPRGKDIIQASSNTFYRGVTLEDLKNFREK